MLFVRVNEVKRFKYLRFLVLQASWLGINNNES